MESILYQAAESFTCAWSSSTKNIPWNSNATKILMYLHWKHLKSLVSKKKKTSSNPKKLNPTHFFPLPLRSSLFFFSLQPTRLASAFSWDNQVPSIDASRHRRGKDPRTRNRGSSSAAHNGKKFFGGEGGQKYVFFSLNGWIFFGVKRYQYCFFVGQNSSNRMLMVATCLIRLVFLWNVWLMFWFCRISFLDRAENPTVQSVNPVISYTLLYKLSNK